MELYNYTLKRLVSVGFEELLISELKTLGMTFYRKEHLFVILQSWDQGMSTDDVMDQARLLRRRFLELRYNAWNAYFILTADERHVDEDTLFLVERDASALRKYLIRKKTDLDRIPFLDSIPVETLDVPLGNAEKALEESNYVIQGLLSLLKSNQGDTSRFTQNMIEQISEAILND